MDYIFLAELAETAADREKTLGMHVITTNLFMIIDVYISFQYPCTFSSISEKQGLYFTIFPTGAM